MSQYLLDTTPLTALLFDRPAAIRLIRPWITQREVVTSLLVYGEVVEYLKGLDEYARLHSELRKLLRGIYPLAPTYAIMERYAEIRRAMRRRGPGLIGDVDTLIAATALDRGLIVVTADTDYQRVPGLNALLIPRASLDVR